MGARSKLLWRRLGGDYDDEWRREPAACALARGGASDDRVLAVLLDALTKNGSLGSAGVAPGLAAVAPLPNGGTARIVLALRGTREPRRLPDTLRVVQATVDALADRLAGEEGGDA